MLGGSRLGDAFGFWFFLTAFILLDSLMDLTRSAKLCIRRFCSGAGRARIEACMLVLGVQMTNVRRA